MSFAKTRGYTLVEIAVVLTLMGILIGVVLKGQQMMISSRIDATIAQVEAFEAATTTFRDTFGGLPGDLPLARLRLPDCNLGACSASNVATVGDGMVGAVNWSAAWQRQVDPAGALITTEPALETVLFWNHLFVAGLTSEVSNTVMRSSAGSSPLPAWTETHPAARIGGGFVVGWGNGGARPPGSPAGPGAVSPKGLLLAIVQNPTSNLTETTTKPLTPRMCWQIDFKMDDGSPNKGFIVGYGMPVTAPNNWYAGTVAERTYNEVVTTRSCGLVFTIQ